MYLKNYFVGEKWYDLPEPQQMMCQILKGLCILKMPSAGYVNLLFCWAFHISAGKWNVLLFSTLKFLIFNLATPRDDWLCPVLGQWSTCVFLLVRKGTGRKLEGWKEKALGQTGGTSWTRQRTKTLGEDTFRTPGFEVIVSWLKY